MTASGDFGPNGQILPDMASLFPDVEVVRRTGSINADRWPQLGAAVEATGRRKVTIAGVSTTTRLQFPALDLLADGYEVSAVIDASGSERRIARMTPPDGFFAGDERATPAARGARSPLNTKGTTEMPQTMRAVVLDGPGPPEALVIRELPVPVPADGWVLIEVKAFGLNRSELHTRLGLAVGVTFPRVLGIEATGVVAQCPGGEFGVGQHVVAMMGGMGRTFDGGYAQYTSVPAGQVIAFRSDLDWATVGAVPEMLQTSYGCLTAALDAQPGDSILIRGGTSSVGMTTAVLAKQRGMTVLSTTRDPDRAAALTALGVDHALVDDGDVARQVHAILPDGVNTALELVGTPTLPDTLRATRARGVVCFAGMLSNVWTVRDFYPIDYLPRAVRLTAYSGEARDLPPRVLQDFLDAVAAGEVSVPIGRVYGFDEIVAAHAAMEAGDAIGKLVVTT